MYLYVNKPTGYPDWITCNKTRLRQNPCVVKAITEKVWTAQLYSSVTSSVLTSHDLTELPSWLSLRSPVEGIGSNKSTGTVRLASLQHSTLSKKLDLFNRSARHGQPWLCGRVLWERTKDRVWPVRGADVPVHFALSCQPPGWTGCRTVVKVDGHHCLSGRLVQIKVRGGLDGLIRTEHGQKYSAWNCRKVFEKRHLILMTLFFLVACSLCIWNGLRIKTRY